MWLSKLLPTCPEKLRSPIATTHTFLHCTYWGHSTVSDIIVHGGTLMTPVYGMLFVLTLAMYSVSEKQVGS